MKNQALTPDQWESIKQRITEGLSRGDSIQDMALKLDRTHSTVCGWVRAVRQGRSPAAGQASRADLLAMLADLFLQGGKTYIKRRAAIKAVPALGSYGQHWGLWSDFHSEALKLAFTAAPVTEAPRDVERPDALPPSASSEYIIRVDSEGKPIPDAPAVPPEEDLPMAERERRKYQDQMKGMRNRMVGLERELNEVEDVRRAVFGLAEQEVEPRGFEIARDPGDSYTGTPILYFSDAQWGEVVRAGEMDGTNEYNMEVASRRYQKLIRKSIDLCTTYQKFPSYQRFAYVRAGDLINGDIHEELRKTNDLAAIPAAKDLVEHEIWGINQLLDLRDDKGAFVFPQIDIISVPGNHGRNTERPEHKGFVGTNYETVTAYLLQSWFRDHLSNAAESRIRFVTPASGDAIETIEDQVFCFTHGDRIGSRGGEGFIGPAATIMRGMMKVHAYYNRIRRPVNYVMTGHFHTSLYLGLGFGNGSLCGLNEFAKSFRMIPDAPKQWLLFAHKHYGVSQMWEIIVDKPPVWSGHTSLTITPKVFA